MNIAPKKKYTFDKRIFNKQFFDIEEKCSKEHKRFLIVYGGSGSGKSYLIAQREIIKLLKEKQNLLVIRKYATSLNDSTFALFKEILDSWKIPYKANLTNKTIFFENGSKIIQKGCDNPEKLKSVVNISRVWIEEATELEEADLHQINARIRGIHLKNPQITLTFNPVSELHWIKRLFFDIERDDVYTFHSSYRDNKFIDEEYKKQMEAYVKISYNHFRIYCLGEWGVVSTGSESYDNFDVVENEKQSVKDKWQYNPSLPLFLSFDENVVPYSALIVAQKIGDTIVILDEVTEDNKPINHVVKKFAEKWGHHKSGIIITGDASSQKRDVKQDTINTNFFNLIKRDLDSYGFKCQMRTNKYNNNVYMRILFANYLFANNRIVINKKAKKTILDFQKVAWADSGVEKNKHKVTKKLTDGTKQTYEEFGHLSDCVDYLVQSTLMSEFQRWSKGNKAKSAYLSMKQSNKF